MIQSDASQTKWDIDKTTIPNPNIISKITFLAEVMTNQSEPLAIF